MRDSQDGDLLLNQVWLLLNHGDDLVDGFGDWNWDVLDDRNNVRLGNPDRDRHWVRFRDGNRLRDVDDVRLRNLIFPPRESVRGHRSVKEFVVVAAGSQSDACR